MFSTKDGYVWTPKDGLQAGMSSVGAIYPPQSFGCAASETFDVIVIGAGYTGLTAARDVAIQGQLPLEPDHLFQT